MRTLLTVGLLLPLFTHAQTEMRIGSPDKDFFQVYDVVLGHTWGIYSMGPGCICAIKRNNQDADQAWIEPVMSDMYHLTIDPEGSFPVQAGGKYPFLVSSGGTDGTELTIACKAGSYVTIMDMKK